MFTKAVLVALALGQMFIASEASAQIFKLEFTPNAGMNAAIRTAIETEVRKIENEINKDLPSASNPNRLMEGMANSSIMAGKGIGNDYASNIEVMLVGAGLGVGADLEKNKEAKSDISGVGVQGGLTLGTNLHWLDTSRILGLDTNRLNVFVNFLKYDTDRQSGDTDAKLNMTSYGMHVSYNWIPPRKSTLWGWGGVKVHTGYEYNRTRMRFSSQIREELNQNVGGDTYSSNIVANPFAQIDVSTSSIPIELSTSLRFLYLFTLYGGVGMDYNFGSARGRGDLNSPTAPVNCTDGGAVPNSCSGTAGGGTGQVGTITASANIDGSGSATPFLFRGFTGLQVNLWRVRVFAQVDKALGNDLVGATAGVRFAY